MNVSAKELSEIINLKLEQLNDNLPLRAHSLLDEFRGEKLKGKDEVELFGLLVSLIVMADKVPAEVIANLLVLVNSESIHQLDDWTVSNSASFLRDYIKKEQAAF